MSAAAWTQAAAVAADPLALRILWAAERADEAPDPLAKLAALVEEGQITPHEASDGLCLVRRATSDRIAARVRLGAEAWHELADEDWEARTEPEPAPERQPPRRPVRVACGDAESFEWLDEVPPPVYVEALTGQHVPRDGRIRCPLHGDPPGSERTPSMKVYAEPGRGRGSGWHCFSCGAGGDAFTLASRLWGLPTRGRSFVELRERLAEALGGLA